MKRPIVFTASLIVILVMFCHATLAQSTDFTYQGRLLNGTVPANGSHDFEFSLFDAITGVGQIGSTVSLTAVNVNNGVFSVRIDFGNQFPGANRYLEIRVKEAGGAEFTTLTPRQAISSAPYAIKSLNAENAANANSATSANTAANSLRLSGVDGRLYVLTGDTRLSDARTPLPNSPTYIQNTTQQQATSNFNITGNGTVGGTLSGNVVTAATQFNIGEARVLRIDQFSNTFVGSPTGSVNTTGSLNTLVGYGAGVHITNGNTNSVFGAAAGTGITGGSRNSVFGVIAGQNTTTGDSNSFFGDAAGKLNDTGNDNSFFGKNAGSASTTGGNNTAIGANANVGSGALSFATAIGAGAIVATSNTVILGRSSDTVLAAGKFKVTTLGSAASTQVCRNGSFELSTCSSSIRYKTNINPFNSGLTLIRRLRPVSFSWKDGGMLDLGLVAEEVNRVEQLLTTTNDKGEVEGVKYDRVGVVLVNAVNEQQAQIENQQKRIDSQQKQIEEQKVLISRQQAGLDALKKLVCSQNLAAELCLPNN